MKKHCKNTGYIDSLSINLTYKLFFLLVCGYGLCLHISPSDIDYNIHMFTYFTVISNFFCFITTLIYVVKAIKYNFLQTNISIDLTTSNIFTPRYVLIKGTSLMAIILTFLIYHFMVAKYKYPLLYNKILNLPAKDLFAHYIIPLLYVFDWLLFHPKDLNNAKSPLCWMWYPLAYLVLIMLRAFCFPKESILYLKKFPYFFLDITRIGLDKFIIYMILILFVALAIGYTILGIEKLILRISQRR